MANPGPDELQVGADKAGHGLSYLFELCSLPKLPKISGDESGFIAQLARGIQ